MRKAMLLPAVSGNASLLRAQSPFDGTFQCPACDALAVKVMDGKTVEATCEKGGKVVESGKTLTLDATLDPEGKRQPTGPHAASGSRRKQKAGASENLITRTPESTADGMRMTNPIGESFNAKFDCKDCPNKGDPNHGMASRTKVDDRSFDGTVKRDGRILSVGNKAQGASTGFNETKQQESAGSMDVCAQSENFFSTAVTTLSGVGKYTGPGSLLARTRSYLDNESLCL